MRGSDEYALSISDPPHSGDLSPILAKIAERLEKTYSNGEPKLFSTEAAAAISILRRAEVDLDILPVDRTPINKVRELLGYIGPLAALSYAEDAATEKPISLSKVMPGESVFSFSERNGMDWLDVIELNELEWPYFSDVERPGVLVPGRSEAKVFLSGGRIGNQQTGSPSNGIQEEIRDYELQESGDYTSDNSGWFSLVGGPENLIEALRRQFKTAEGFFPEVPGYGFFALRPDGQIGNFGTTERIESFRFKIARMVTLNGRLSPPRSVDFDSTAGVIRIEFETSPIENISIEL